MAQTPCKYVGPGDAIDFTPGADVKAGEVIVTNGFAAIVAANQVAGGLAAKLPDGLWDVPKVTGEITAGSAVFWDADGNPNVGEAGSGGADDDDDSEENAFLGFAVATAASGDKYVRVLMVKTTELTVNINGALTNIIADPGNAGAIPVTASGHVPIVTAGSETRTLARPAFVGQELLLFIKTDGGTCVITVAAPVNQTADNTITMADVNDSIRLHGIDNNGSLVWRVVCNDGSVLSTV